jgi:phage antirepressor YoqD-like protein
MVAEIDVVIQSVARVSFFIPMTVTNYTRLQTLLRSDGYQIKSVKIAGKELIVEDLINQDLPHIADKKLIEFLNLYPISESKLFTWIRKNEIQNTLATETLLMTSDKEQIMLTWDFPQFSNTVTQ